MFRLRLLDSPLSTSTFTVAGWPSWLAQDTRSAVVLLTRPRSTPHELRITLDAPFPSRSRRTGPLFPPSRVGPRSPRPESPLLKIRSRIRTLLPYSRSWPSRDSRSRVLTTEWPPPRAATRLPPAWFLTTSAVRAPAPLGDCCTPAGQDSHRFGHRSTCLSTGLPGRLHRNLLHRRPPSEPRVWTESFSR